jgi:hypothetical protein
LLDALHRRAQSRQFGPQQGSDALVSDLDMLLLFLKVFHPLRMLDLLLLLLVRSKVFAARIGPAHIAVVVASLLVFYFDFRLPLPRAGAAVVSCLTVSSRIAILSSQFYAFQVNSSAGVLMDSPGMHIPDS